uniref:GDSL esterase/lipase n=1 Tax=Opuntia streptacantha TaxID=393608 RepID=A0A7C8ZES2_OPUST
MKKMRERKSCFSLSFEALLVVLILGLQFLEGVNGGCEEAPVIFSFGDSNADTGGLAAGLGFPVNPPNGRSFFGRSTGRLSDGRLVIDFLCKFPPLPKRKKGRKCIGGIEVNRSG